MGAQHVCTKITASRTKSSVKSNGSQRLTYGSNSIYVIATISQPDLLTLDILLEFHFARYMFSSVIFALCSCIRSMAHKLNEKNRFFRDGKCVGQSRQTSQTLPGVFKHGWRAFYDGNSYVHNFKSQMPLKMAAELIYLFRLTKSP